MLTSIAAQSKTYLLFIYALLIVVFIAVLSTSPLAAQSGILTQGFQGNASLPTGALVSLTNNNSESIELSTTSLAEQLVGVVNERAFLELSDTDSTIQVVLDGTTATLVSDLNGTISKGDRITVSPVAGVGMKATESAIIVGIAQADLSSVDTTTRSITDRDGRTRSIHVGLVPVQINVAAYVSPTNDQKEGGISAALQNIASTIAGRPISPVRAILAAIITLLLMTIIVVVLYAAVRSSIISIGRNPLSESSLRKSLVRVGLIVLGLAIIGFAIVYAILRI
jgi:hypothetical protein